MDCIEIPLGGKHLGKQWAVIDMADYKRIIQRRWFLIPGGYVCCNEMGDDGVNRRPKLHRVVLELERGNPLCVDHINGDPLDNRRSNLRLVTHAENLQNQRSRQGSSKYRGVSWNKASKKWTASFMVGGVATTVGSFADEEAAHIAVSAARAAAMPFSQEQAA